MSCRKSQDKHSPSGESHSSLNEGSRAKPEKITCSNLSFEDSKASDVYSAANEVCKTGEKSEDSNVIDPSTSNGGKVSIECKISDEKSQESTERHSASTKQSCIEGNSSRQKRNSITNDYENSSSSSVDKLIVEERQKSHERDKRQRKEIIPSSLPAMRFGSRGRFSRPDQGSDARRRSYVKERPQGFQGNDIQHQNRSQHRSRSPRSFERRFSPPRRRSPNDKFSRLGSHFGRSQYFRSPDSRDTYENRQHRDGYRSRSPAQKRPSSPRVFLHGSYDRSFSPDGLVLDEWQTDSRPLSPEARRISPDAMRISPDVRRFPVDARHPSPDARRLLPDARRHSPDARRHSPDARRHSPYTRRHSPGARRHSPGARRFSPGARRFSPGARRFSPGARRFSPGARRFSPGARRHSPDARRHSPDARHPSLYERRQFDEREGRRSFTFHNDSDRSFSPREQGFRNENKFPDRHTLRAVRRSASRGSLERFHRDPADRRHGHRSPPGVDSRGGHSTSPHVRGTDIVTSRNGRDLPASDRSSPRLPSQLPRGSTESRRSLTSEHAKSSQDSNSLIKNALSSMAVLHNDECRAYMKRPTSHPRYNTELSVYLGSPDCLSLIALGTPQNSIIDHFNSYVWVNKLQEVFEEDWQKKKQDMLKLMSENKKSSRPRKKSSGSTSKRAETVRSPSQEDGNQLASGKTSPVSRSSEKKGDDDSLSMKPASPSSENLQSHDSNHVGVHASDISKSALPSSKDETGPLPEPTIDLKINKSSAPGGALATIYSQLFKTSQPLTVQESKSSNPNIGEKKLALPNRSSERYSPGMESDTSTHSPNLLDKYIQPPVNRTRRSRSPELSNNAKSALDSSPSDARNSESGGDAPKPDVNVVSVLAVVNEFAHKIGDLAEGVSELLQRTEASVKHGIDPLKCFFEDDRRLCASVHERLNAIVSATSTSFIEKVIVREALSQLSSLLALFHAPPRRVSESEMEEWAGITLRMNTTDTILFLKNKMSQEPQGFTQTVEQLYMAVKERHKHLIKSDLQDKISFFLPSTGDSNSINKSSLVNSRNLSKNENPSLLNRVHPAFSIYDDVDDDEDAG